MYKIGETVKENNIEFVQVKNDINGNPRYVTHFTSLLKNNEQELQGFFEVKYKLALIRARRIGGKKYHTKNFGGGIVFTSYNLEETAKNIKNSVNLSEGF